MIVVSEQEISIVSFLQELKNMKRMYYWVIINIIIAIDLYYSWWGQHCGAVDGLGGQSMAIVSCPRRSWGGTTYSKGGTVCSNTNGPPGLSTATIAIDGPPDRIQQKNCRGRSGGTNYRMTGSLLFILHSDTYVKYNYIAKN